MSDEILDRIDAEIAENLMGYVRTTIGGILVYATKDDCRISWQPTRDANDLAEVKREIERRGWWYRTEYRPPALQSEGHCVFIDTMTDGSINAIVGDSDTTEGEALCRAVLAALGVKIEVPE